jgi:hypothetical protein
VSISNHISGVLSGHNIKFVGLSPKKIAMFLQAVKGDLRLKTRGICNIPCKCGQSYMEQADRSIGAKVKEHCQLIRLEHPDSSAVAEHSMTLSSSEHDSAFSGYTCS